MFKRILVAVDRTDVSRRAYDKAIALARLFDANVMILHILHDHEAGSPRPPMSGGLPYVAELNDILRENYRREWHTFETEYANYLRWLTEEARLDGADAEFAQEMGDPGRRICEFAREWQADLVITGSQGRSGLSELLLGSVSSYVAHHAPCSVMVVHQGDRTSDGLPSDIHDAMTDEAKEEIPCLNES